VLLAIIISPEMPSETAKLPFFSKENAANWVVVGKWHEYQTEIIRRGLGRSAGSSSTGIKER
jgi:hypothetical protein